MNRAYDHHKATMWFYDADDECKPHEMVVLAALLAHPDLEELFAHEKMGAADAVVVSSGVRAALVRWREMSHWERGNALVALADQMKETVMNVARREWAKARAEEA